MAISYTHYSTAPTLAVGMTLYTNSALTTTAPAGYYSNGTYCYECNSSGAITVITDCGIATTSTTTQEVTTTTTLPGSTRRTLHMSSTLVAKEGTATSNISPFISPNVSFAEMIANDPTLEQWNVKAGTSNVQRFATNLSTSFNGVSVSPTYTFTDGAGNQIIKSVKEFYAYYKKFISDTDLVNRNAVIKLHRIKVDVGVSQPLSTYYAITIDFDEMPGDTIDVTQTGYGYTIYNTPHNIVLPSPSSEYAAVTDSFNYTGSYASLEPSSDPSWAVGSNMPGTNNLIEELNITVPQTW